MKPFLAITKALNDPTRLRALLVLREGELCLCQMVELFGLAPSTVSKHLTILYEAGLVERRKEGRWAYFRLAGRQAAPAVKQALKWVTASVSDSPVVHTDQRKLASVKSQDVKSLCGCYASS
ncbi:MAG: winged helix-turn-helix transcriptional regulator [Planctomycetes bacterium]|nr:winged helix-turn-helix transcriptional regulator [Planctomycetota bacterium]